MAQTIELPLSGGGSVLFEVDEGSAGRSYRGAGDSVVRAATETFESVIGKLRPVAAALASELSNLAGDPEVKVEFGVKLNADAGWVVARAGGEASLCISLSWPRAERAGNK